MNTKRIALTVAMITVLAGGVNASAADVKGSFGSATATDNADPAFQSMMARGKLQRPISSQLMTRGRSECAAAATLCGFSSVGFVLGCGAAVYASFGTLTPECAAVFAGVGGSCATAAAECTGTGTPANRRLSSVGDMVQDAAGDYFVERTCAYPRFVDQVKVEWFLINGAASNGRVSRVTLRCNANASGTTSTLVFGHAGGTGSNTYACSAGRLQAGFLIRAGQEVDALGGVCRRVSTTDLTTYVNGTWGGTGGTRQDRVCASGTNLVGAKMQMDGANESNANIIGIEPICR
jgi:hypothetical protein